LFKSYKNMFVFAIFFALLISILPTQIVQATLPRSRTISILRIDGRNSAVYRPNGQQIRAHRNLRLADGFRLSTGAATEMYLRMDMGSVFKLSPNTDVSISLVDEFLSLTVDRGGALVNVPQSQTNRQLHLNIGSVAMTVRGTMFTLGHGEDFVFITMLTGAGDVLDAPLEEGQILTAWTADAEVEVPISGEIITEWVDPESNLNLAISEIYLEDLDYFTLNSIYNNSEYLLENSSFVDESILERIPERLEELRPPAEEPPPRLTTLPPIPSDTVNQEFSPVASIVDFVSENANGSRSAVQSSGIIAASTGQIVSVTSTASPPATHFIGIAVAANDFEFDHLTVHHQGNDITEQIIGQNLSLPGRGFQLSGSGNIIRTFDLRFFHRGELFGSQSLTVNLTTAESEEVPEIPDVVVPVATISLFSDGTLVQTHNTTGSATEQTAPLLESTLQNNTLGLTLNTENVTITHNNDDVTEILLNGTFPITETETLHFNVIVRNSAGNILQTGTLTVSVEVPVPTVNAVLLAGVFAFAETGGFPPRVEENHVNIINDDSVALSFDELDFGNFPHYIALLLNEDFDGMGEPLVVNGNFATAQAAVSAVTENPALNVTSDILFFDSATLQNTMLDNLGTGYRLSQSATEQNFAVILLDNNGNPIFFHPLSIEIIIHQNLQIFDPTIFEMPIIEPNEQIKQEEKFEEIPIYELLPLTPTIDFDEMGNPQVIHPEIPIILPFE